MAAPSTNPPRRWAAPLAIFCGTLLLYLTTLTQVHTFDALSYVTSVERKPWTEVFHPHHLAYGPLGALALALARGLGYDGGAALPMQFVNALAGALGVALFFVIVRGLTRRADLALATALLLGGAYAYWYYAIEIEVYTVATLLLLVCLALLVRLAARLTPRDLALLGLAQGGAVLFHQTNLLLCVAVLVLLLADRRPLALLRHGLAYGLPLALVVGLPYLLVGLLVSQFRSWADFMAWLTEYARTGWWGGPLTAQKWADLAGGLADTLAQPGGALLGLLLLGLALLGLRGLLQHAGGLVAVLLAWLLTYGGFFLWWEPDNIEFWIASLPPLLLLLALALCRARRWGPEVLLTLALALTAAALNYDSIKRRGDPATDLQRVVAAALASQSQPADLLLLPDGLLELYLPYYERRDNFVSLNQVIFDHANQWEAACTTLQARVATTLHAGAAVVLADQVLHPPAELLARHQLRQEQIERCFSPYQAALQRLPMPATAPAYWRIATGQERAAAGGWTFAGFAEGWQAANVSASDFANGWTLTPGADPSLTSPLLQLDAKRYRALRIRLACATGARDAQLFYAGPDGQIDEARSVRWTLDPGTAAVSYTIDLQAAPGWSGQISRLRLDPVGLGDGAALRIEAIELVPR